jgi:hypothetical protein
VSRELAGFFILFFWKILVVRCIIVFFAAWILSFDSKPLELECGFGFRNVCLLHFISFEPLFLQIFFFFVSCFLLSLKYVFW